MSNIPQVGTTREPVQKTVTTKVGDIAYVEYGSGPVALFVHGVFLNGDTLWREAMVRLGDVRRCIALDLFCHGRTGYREDQDLSTAGQAEMLENFCEALGIDQVDLVGNDSGGAFCQIFAARHPSRIRSLILTNCDTHDGWPPPEAVPLFEAATDGTLRQQAHGLVHDVEAGRGFLGLGYQHPERLTAEKIRAVFEPVLGTPEAITGMERWHAAADNRDTVAVEPQLRRLTAPTLIIWGTGDQFFDIRWAEWLRDTIPGAEQVITIEDGKLFFVDERVEEFAPLVRAHWLSN
ncbi:alpha/beta fold hydrolase [Pseudonocardia spinosispora]|uniref:alpha/beta fold hydrolase n=1 Tax=Pseudonocardia spinosispora TaxID=103441 RepID=UPI000419652D|nr:alpha/beta hydrolase [Pseudonocardia spinosispora]